MTLRLGFLRVYQESNGFSSRLTTRATFEQGSLVLRDGELDRQIDEGSEIPGYVRRAEYAGFRDACRQAGAEAVPLFSAIVVPSGPQTPETVAWLKEELRDGLRRAGHLDGVVLALHGAAQAVGGAAVDPQLLACVREAAGERAVVAVTFDLHVNLTPDRLRGADFVTAYHTNPHRDMDETAARATRVVVGLLEGRLRLTTALRRLPVVLGGGLGVDLVPPMMGVFARARLAELPRRVIDVSLTLCHPFIAGEDLGWAVLVTTDDDQALADRIADRMADALWAARRHPLPEFVPIPEAVDRVARARLARATGVVSLVDAGDVVAAGAPGDNPALLAHLLSERPGLRICLPVYDPEATDALWRHATGQRAEVDVGPAGARVAVAGVVGGRATSTVGRRIVVRDGPVSVVVSEQPPLTIHPGFYRELGLSMRRHDAAVQKSFFHYLWQWPRYHRRTVTFSSPGATSLDHVRGLDLPFAAWPMQDPPDWRPHDRALRG